MLKLRKRETKVPMSNQISAAEFKEHFGRVSRDRFEEDPEVLEAVVGVVSEGRNAEKVREANEIPEREEIEAMRDTRVSPRGGRGADLFYTRGDGGDERNSWSS